MGASHNRGRSKQDYATPMVLITAVKNRLGIGGFAVDLAADEANAKADMWIDEGRNSLALDWRLVIGAGWGWLNPPFDNITPWAKKCAETDAKIAFLVPASVGSNWYRDYVHRHAFTLFLNGRVPFMPDKPKWLFPKDCMVCLYGYGKVGNDVWTWRPEKATKAA